MRESSDPIDRQCDAYFFISPTDVGAIASIATAGDSYDRALAEIVVGLYKTEDVKIDGPFRTADEREFATLVWVLWLYESQLRAAHCSF